MNSLSSPQTGFFSSKPVTLINLKMMKYITQSYMLTKKISIPITQGQSDHWRTLKSNTNCGLLDYEFPYFTYGLVIDITPIKHHRSHC